MDYITTKPRDATDLAIDAAIDVASVAINLGYDEECDCDMCSVLSAYQAALDRMTDEQGALTL